jgi:NAD(P)-dependent dehydrogenase (short-subunit alcohol dehydrogenase family)
MIRGDLRRTGRGPLSRGLGVESARVLAAHGARLVLAVRELGKGGRV